MTSEVDRLLAELKPGQAPAERGACLKALGAAYLGEGNGAEALRAYGAALSLAPTDGDAVSGVRQALVATSRYAEAVEWFQREIVLAPDDGARSRLYEQLGGLYEKQLGNLELALRAYAKAHQLAHGEEPTALPPNPPPHPPLTPAGPAPTVGPARTTTTPPPRKPSAVTPTPQPRPARAAPRLRARSLWLALGLGAGCTAASVTLWRWPRAPREVRCPGLATPVVVERDQPAQRVVYQCGDEASARRWTYVGETLESTVDYAGAVPSGPAAYFRGPGNRTEGQHASGWKTGTWKDFQGGTLTRTEEWQAGKRWGWSRVLQGDGGVREEQQWVNDVPEGRWAKHDEEGRLLEEGRLTDGRRAGVWTRYSTQGDVTARWTEPTSSGEPVGPREGRGDGPSSGSRLDVLFAGMTLSEWQVRVAELTRASAADPTLRPLVELALHRAELAGLQVAASGQLEEPDR